MEQKKITFDELYQQKEKLILDNEEIYEYNEEEIYEKQQFLNDNDEEEIYAKINILNHDNNCEQFNSKNRIILDREEIFKPINIDIHASYYIISNFGNIISFKTINPLIMKPYAGRSYPTITLSYKNKNYKYFMHTLVAKTFVENPNPEEFNQVNHIDGIKSNYKASNLEWCNQAYNNHHARTVLGICGRKVAVNQLKLNGKIAATYESIAAASKGSGESRTDIAAVCEGSKDKTLIWRWEYVIPRVIEDAPDGKELAGYPGYIITSDGRVYSSKIRRFMRLQQDDEDDYVSVWLSDKNKGKKFYVHKLVGDLYLDPIPGKIQINHKDRIKANVGLDNLERMSASENVQHAVSTGVTTGKKAVIKCDMEGKELEEYESIAAAVAANPKANGSCISKICNGRQGKISSGDFKWIFKDKSLRPGAVWDEIEVL